MKIFGGNHGRKPSAIHDETAPLPQVEKLEKQGWFGRQELEQFIFLAREQQKLESLVWLMRLKDRKYGYEERKLII